MSVVVVATVRPLPAYRAEVVAAFEDTIAQVHAEDEGCELYALHEGDDRLVMVEKWASPQALDQHSHGNALAELTRRLDGKLADDPDLQILRPHPAGTAQQATV